MMTPERRARVNSIKKAIVIVNFSILFIAIVGCIVLGTRVCSMDGEIKALEAKLSKLETENSNKNQPENNPDNNILEDESKENQSDDSLSVNQEQNGEKVAYLTFDDGPSDSTYAILDILDRYNVKATFFVNGKDYNSYADQYKEIVKRGHSIGMHSYSHAFEQVYESLDSFKSDTEKIHDFLYELTGVDVKLYRFPGGSSTTRTTQIELYIDYLNSKGYTYYDWNVSSGDAAPNKLSSEQIINNVMNGINGLDRGIVLMHDSTIRDTTVEALPVIIEKLLEEGYIILPITDMTPPVHHAI